MRAMLREPLLHFVVLGLALFALDAAVGGGEAPPSPRDTGSGSGLPMPTGPIVVDEDVRATLVSHWSQTHDAPPTAAELEGLVSRWIDREVLYREGLARGLAIGDSQIQDRVVSQMVYVLRQQVKVETPTDAQLRQWFADHTDRFAVADRIDFTQVFVAGTDADAQARARELLALLEGGASPDGLGDTFAGGRRFRGRTLEALAIRFGETFVEGLGTQPLQTWALRRSPEGLHLVRVDGRSVGQAPAFEDVRDAVAHDWQEDARVRQLSQATAGLRAKWDVVES